MNIQKEIPCLRMNDFAFTDLKTRRKLDILRAEKRHHSFRNMT
jgi:hypothetical protein